MLLEMQTTGTHVHKLSTTGTQILLTMWKGWGADTGLPPAAGKRRTDRGNTEYTPVHVIFRPRPFIKISIQNHLAEALIDTGAEVSLINNEIAKLAQDHVETDEQIRLANGDLIDTPNIATVEIKVGSRKYNHRFRILPTLENPVVIGMDLWSRLQLNLPPSPTFATSKSPPVNMTTKGLAPCTTEETTHLQKFLNEELRKFQQIKGPTSGATHKIRLKPGVEPIKQRYRPRNPAMQEIINSEVEKMEREGIIEPSHSAWNSPVVLIKKKTADIDFA